MDVSPTDFRAALLLLASGIGEVLTPERATEVVALLRADGGYPFDGSRMEPLECGGYSIRLEPFGRSEELDFMQSEYHSETGLAGTYSYDYDSIERIYRTGGLAQVVGRGPDGKAAGLLRLFILRNELTGDLECHDNMFYVAPAHRGSSLALRIWRYAEQAMFDHGVKHVHCHSRLENGADRMARFLGYTPTALVHTKVLEEATIGRAKKGKNHG